MSWHKLKHSCATQLLTNGVLLPAIDVLGHTNIDVTCIYTHVAPGMAWDYMQTLSTHHSRKQADEVQLRIVEAWWTPEGGGWPRRRSSVMLPRIDMTPGKHEDTIILVESLKNTLTSHATGGGGDESLFTNARRTLIEDRDLAKVTPRWLKSCRSLDDFWGMIKYKFAHYQERRDWLRTEFEPIFDLLEGRSSKPADASITDALGNSGGEYVHDSWQKALARRDQDPDGAITIARTLLEEVCRFVLDEQGEIYDEKADLPKLYGLVAKRLMLAPSQHTEQIFKQILGGCHSIVEGLGALRSRIGDAHAKGKTGMRASPRHAAFAVNIAGATASFIIETYEARKKDGTLR